MMRKQIVPMIAAVSALVTPIAALAATITVAPLDRAAPVMSLPLLAGLALLMAATGMWVLRRTSATSIAALVAVGTATLLVASGYAIPSTIHINGAACSQRTVINYSTQEILENDCDNAVAIVALDACDNDNDTVISGPPVGICEVGLVLQANNSCELPPCV